MPATGKVADAKGTTLVHCAARNGHLPLLQYLQLSNVATAADMVAPDNRGLTAMHMAALHGHIACVKYLADSPSPGVDTADANQRTPLLFAALQGHLEVAEVLVAAGAASDTVDAFGRSALHYAAGCGSAALCSTLGATAPAALVTLVDIDGRSPLHYAAGSSDCDSVKYFLTKIGAAAAGVVQGDNARRTPFHFAGWFGNQEAIDWMVEEIRGCGDLASAVNATDQLGRSAVHYAAHQGMLDSLEALLRTDGAIPDLKDTIGRTALDAASFAGRAEACNVLIEHGGSINVCDLTGRTPTMAAAALGNEEVLDALFGDDEVEVDCLATDRTTGRTALMLAITACSPTCVSMLLENDASAVNVQDTAGLSPLHLAVLLAKSDLDPTLLEAIREDLGANGVDISLVDARGRSLAHIAAMAGASEMLQSLGENEVALNALDNEGHTPMDYACYFGMEDCVATLLSDEDFEHANAESNPFGPLHCAAFGGFADCIETYLGELWDAKPSVNVLDGCGNTALHIAAAGGSAECVAALVDADGIDLTLTDAAGVSAMMLAADKGHTFVCCLLVDAGAPYTTVDAEGRNCCHLAFIKGTPGEGAETMLRSVGEQVEQAGGSPVAFFSEAKTAAGATVAHLAAVNHDVASLQYLKGVGVDLTVPDNDGVPPILHLISDESGRACLKLLLGIGPDAADGADEDGSAGFPADDASREVLFG